MEKTNFDIELVSKTSSMYEELSGLTSQIDIDPEKIGEAKVACAKAWTYLHEALHEIYAAGRYIFMDEPEIEELFYIDYLQEVAKMAKRGKKEENEQESVTETL